MADQSRKWQITINNPETGDREFNHDKLKEILASKKSIIYWCMSDEVGGNTHTPHTHLYIALNSGMRFETLKNMFPGAHLEMCKGTSVQNRDYVFKQGKWENDEKGVTNIKDTHEEFGEMPQEVQGKRNDLEALYDMIKEGLSNHEILEEDPMYIMNIEKIEKARQVVREEKYKSVYRNVGITYIYGVTGTGKSRGIMEKHGYENVFRVTNLLHPFDGYNGEEAIVFEEFHGQYKMNDMLNWTDGYPLKLPARYNDRQACFTHVYITSNMPLEQQYRGVQFESPNTWNALKRRIKQVTYYDGQSITDYYQVFDKATGISDYLELPF
jgi:hypothetical protein